MVKKVLAVQKVMRSIFNFQTARTEDLDSFENYGEIYAHLGDRPNRSRVRNFKPIGSKIWYILYVVHPIYDCKREYIF